MGMFDYIQYEAPLPLNKKQQKMFSHVDWTKEDFQTKDLENIMSHYYVTKNGNLQLEVVQGEHVKKPKPKDHSGFWFPYEFIEKSRTKKKINHTGDVYFYHIIEDSKGDEYWIEFNSTFLKGKLQKTKLANFKIHQTAEEAKQRQLEINALFESDSKKFSTRFRKFMNKITFFYWSKFGRFVVSRSINKIINVLHKLNTLTWRYF